MSQTRRSGSPPTVVDANLSIEPYYGHHVLDGGFAAIPKVFLRFYRYFVSDHEQLNDRLAMVLTQVMTLGADRDHELRISNLPVMTSPTQLEKDKGALRRMGLCFTQRVYYPPNGARLPVLRCLRWDLRPLIFNLSLIQHRWTQEQHALVAAWQRQGGRGHKPVFEFPADFFHEVTLPSDVAADIVADMTAHQTVKDFYPLPEKWLSMARQLCPTATNQHGRAPTAINQPGRPAPTATKTRGHPEVVDVVVDQDQELDVVFSDDAVFAHFAARQGRPSSPTGRDRQSLHELREAGYSLAEILAGIDLAFDRGDQPKRFAYCARIVQDTPPARLLARPLATPELPAESDRLLSSFAIPADLVAVVEVYQSAGKDLRPDVLARLRLLADECDAAARQHASTGADWLAQALQRGLGVADDLLLYAQGVLRNWITSGPTGARATPRVAPPNSTAPVSPPKRDWDSE